VLRHRRLIFAQLTGFALLPTDPQFGWLSKVGRKMISVRWFGHLRFGLGPTRLLRNGDFSPRRCTCL
jgi:hypothetical protein